LHRDRAFCRTKSSICLAASRARCLSPPPIDSPPAPRPASTSPSGFARCGTKADRCLVQPLRRAGIGASRQGPSSAPTRMGSRPPGCVVVPRGTRGAPIFAQNLDHVVFDMRDGIAPRRIYWQAPLRWNRDAQAAARVFCASMADGFHNHPPFGLAHGPLAAHPGHSGSQLVLPHETTAEYRGHAARRLGRRLSERLARHDHGKPDRGEAARPALGGDPGRSPLPQRRADAGGDRPCAQARRARLADCRR